MAQVNIQVTLDNIPSEIDAQQIASILENLVKQYTNVSDVDTSIYDSDGSKNANPITMHNVVRRVS